MVAVRVVLAEDNLLVREGLVRLLEGAPEVELMADVASLPELYEAVEQFGPDVVLTDIRMPPSHRDEGVEAATRLREEHPEIGVVVVSQFAEPEYVLAVLGEGTRGRGYVLKDRVDDRDHLLGALNAVANGGSFIDDEVIAVLMKARLRLVESPLAALSPREYEVLSQLASGRNNRAISAELDVSVAAVEKHTNAIFAKLNLRADDEVNRRVSAVLMYLAGQGAADE